MTEVIRVDGLTKLFRRLAAGHQLRTLKSALLEGSLVAKIRPEDAIQALTDVSFDVQSGESVGLIGSNGSGKSTLLKAVAGILAPTSGTVDVRGRVAALIELGAGFHPEISGRENIFINGAVLGLSRRAIEAKFDEIVEFSGLAEFIDEPVKNYSSGMYVRLGFAVAIHTEPDVLLVDEVLAVGDEAFAHRCLKRIGEFLAGGKTLLMVSHSLGLIEEVCDRVVWLEGGRVRLIGSPRRIIDAYRQSVAEAEGRGHREAKEDRESKEGDHQRDAGETAAAEKLRWGVGGATVESVRVLVDGEERYDIRSGDPVVFEITAAAGHELDDFVFGIALSTPRGIECWGTNTELDDFEPRRLRVGPVTVAVECPSLRLAPGEYLIDIAVHARDGTPYDYRRRLGAFTVTSPQRGVGVYFPEHSWQFSPGVEWEPTPSEGSRRSRDE